MNRGVRNLSETETEVSRRIVQLCKDCLMIVYQFTHDVEGIPLPPLEAYSVIQRNHDRSIVT